MAEKISDKLRKECEAVIYKFFDKMDRSETNSEYYKNLFSKMNNDDFYKFVSLDFPYRFHHKPWVVEPTMDDIKGALNFLGVPLMEKVCLPYVFQDEKGVPVNSKEAIVIYPPVKKMQQFITHKNSVAIDIDNRDMKTGQLGGADKGGKTTDRELESLGILGLEYCMDEFSGPKADSMESKSLMYNTISTTGQVSIKDVKTDNSDSLSKNLMSVYLIGANIMSNIVNEEYMLPYTMKEKSKTIERI